MKSDTAFRSDQQQWEMLATRGHVLLAQVDAYRLKLKLPMVLAGAALLLVYLSFAVAPLLASGAGGVVGWMTRTVAGWTAPKPLPLSPAPVVEQLVPVFPTGMSVDPSIVPALTDVKPEVLHQVELMREGKRTDQCDFTKKVNEYWSDGIDMTPKCRYSADKKRLWIWALVKVDDFRVAPILGVIREENSTARFYNVQVPDSAGLPGMPAINSMDVPRTIAQDFPELVQGAMK